MVYLFGALGIFANMLIFLQKREKRLVLWKLISDVFWALHYLFLGAYSATGIAVIAILREAVFYNNNKKWASSRLWLLFFLLCSIASAVLTWSGPLSLLPTVASVLSIFSLWHHSPQLTCLLGIPISCCMLTYDLFFRSYFGIANEMLSLFTIIFATFKNKKEKTR